MNKYVVISGGLGVLGQRYSSALSEDGYSPLVLDIVIPEDRQGYTGEFLQCDIVSEDDVRGLTAYLESHPGEVHGLINNASCQPEGFTNELEDYLADTYRKVLDVNLLGSYLLIKAVLPFMKQQGFGSIVNIGSIQGVVAPTFQIYEGSNITSPLVYAVAKAGLIHMSKWVAARYGRFNIRCNAITPGGLSDSQKGGSEFEKDYAARTVLGRMAHSRDIAEAVRFLISDRSAYITGHNLVVDGGWTIY